MTEPCQLDPQARRELLKAFARGDDILAIVERFGVSKHHVHYLTRRYRVKRGDATIPRFDDDPDPILGTHRDACRAVRRGFVIPREREPEFIALLIEGLSRGDAAQKMGVLK